MSKYVHVGIVAALVVVGDQLSKAYIRAHIPLAGEIPVIEGLFSIVHFTNTGGAFGLLAGADDSWRIPFFLTVSAIALGVLFQFLRQIPAGHYLLLTALGGVLGGALGNLIDRALVGEVTDFLYFQWRGWAWPAFNVADSFISVGITLLLIQSFFGDDDAAAEQPEPRREGLGA